MDTKVGDKTCPECGEACGAEAQYCWQCGFPVGAVSRTEQDPLMGRVLPGGYHVLESIGVGGMGRVYRAQQRALGRTVAIKIIHPHLAAEAKSLARFMTEARATSQLNHPNTVSVIDFGQTDDGQPYLVMEFLRGKNLAQIVASEGLLPLPRLLGILHQVLLALGEAHALGIIHRDLKPENIIVEPLRRGGDFVKVVDFGLAKLKADEPGTGITMPGIVCGTPDFMAPEQGRGDPIDGRSDLYAVGVVMFWLLCGRLPFEANTPTQVVMMHITQPVPNPREIAPRRYIPDPVLATLFKTLAKDPEARFPDAHTLADTVADLLQVLERTSWRPSDIPGSPTPTTMPDKTVTCNRCRLTVPWGKFCLACAAELPAAVEPKQGGAPTELAFSGREEELRWLSELARRASKKLLFSRIAGDAGVGKSRLLKEFARRQPELKMVVGFPDPYWAEVPGYTLTEVLRQLLTESEVAGLSASHPEPRALVLSELLTGRAANGLTPIVRRRAYRDALLWALERAAARNTLGLAVVFEDLDRVDGVSRQALADLLAAAPQVPALIVGTHSYRFKARGLAEEQDADLLRVLVGLPGPVATQLLRDGLQGRMEIALANSGAGAIAPLYVEQVLRFALEGRTDVPTRLADLVALRVTALVGAQRACVQALAVLGDCVSLNLLEEFHEAAVGEARDTSLEEAILNLISSSIVKREADGTVSLAHPIFHDIVLLATPAEARRELHRRAARLFRGHGAPVEVVAEHSFQGQDVLPALLTLEQAAERASARGDDETATHLLQRGLELARQEIHRGELEDPLSAVVIFGRKLGEVLQAQGLLSDARGVLQEVLDATTPNGFDRAEVLAQLAEVAQRCQQYDEAERLLARAIAIARDGNAPDGLVDGLELRYQSLRSLPSRSSAQSP
jgi:serine/threonine protein kinase/tetratricopeptide (TPR) repeat protein